jgi:hypothetical protein
MGKRGVDNFSSQGARDYLSMLAAKLVATINEIFIDDERLDPAEDGESMFMPSIELLALLCERYDLRPPKPSSVRNWQERYLDRYAAAADEPAGDADYCRERRKVIEKTFRWLHGLAASYWDN